METFRVLIADDHPLVRCGIRETLRLAENIVLVGEASRGDEAQELCRELQPDVLLLDLQMPGATAVATVTYVHKYCLPTRVIILTAYDDEVYVLRMLAEGAAGYVLKDEITDMVVAAIHAVMHGGTWLSPQVMRKVTSRQSRQEDAAEVRLTRRERQVLDVLARGWDNARIADALSLKEDTVRHYASSLYGKINVRSRSEAIIWAQRHGFG